MRILPYRGNSDTDRDKKRPALDTGQLPYTERATGLNRPTL